MLVLNLKELEEKLCIEEINYLIKKSLRETYINPNELALLEEKELLSFYKNNFLETSKFLFKDLIKLYFLIKNYNFNMFENEDLSCFIPNYKENTKGLFSVINTRLVNF